MNRIIVAAGALAVLATVLLLSMPPSAAQEAEPPQRAQLVAAVDISPITKELAALRTELATLRAAVADAEGLRGDVTKATIAVQAVQKQVKELNEAFATYAKTTTPVIQALQPATHWDYRVLRSRSENVAKRLGRDGWELVTASNEWLYFKRPLRGDER